MGGKGSWEGREGMGIESSGREGREGNGSMHPLGFSKVGAYEQCKSSAGTLVSGDIRFVQIFGRVL